MDLIDHSLVRRGAPRDPGVYIKGHIQGVSVWFTVDTGAGRTLVSQRIFNKIIKLNPSIPVLDKNVNLVQADGNSLKELGNVLLEFKLGPLSLNKEVTVADITDDVLLGIDFSTKLDVVTTENKVRIDNEDIPCICVYPSSTRRVSSKQDFIVPPMSEAIIESKVEEVVDRSGFHGQSYVIEPLLDFTDKYGLLTAASLVNVDDNKTVMVRVMNPGISAVTIKRNVVLGLAEPCELMDKSVSYLEDEEELSNLNEIRRLKFISKSESTVTTNCCCTNVECLCMSRGDKYCCITEQGVQSKCCDDVDILRVGTGVTIEQLEDRSQDGNNAETISVDYFEMKLPQHMRDVYNKAADKYSVAEKRKLFEVLLEFQDIFSKDELDLGLTNLAVHEIDTGDARPIKQPPRRPPMALVQEEKAEIDKLLRQGVIRESNSPWASPIVLVRKKNNKVRMCVDYRRLNAVTKVDAYPLPRTQDCLDAMAGASIFSTLDLTAGYNQVPVRDEDIAKTAFVSRHGLFESRVACFGLVNMPATFQRVMELALKGLQWNTCLIYLDDVIVFGTTFDEHLERLKTVFERMRKANFKLKPEKCELLQSEVTFLGHIVSKDGVQPNVANVMKILEWPIPKNVTEVKQFLGLASYYRRMVKNFSLIAKPLNDLVKKDSTLKWDDKCQNAFDELKTKLTSSNIMAFPQESGQFILDTDASDFQIGSVLSQVQDGKEKVIAYASRTLNKSEKNYCVTDKELLAVRYFIEYFRHYLLGHHFLLRTDHQAIKWLFSLREPKGRIARWIEILSAYHFEIEYRPGKKHTNADSLSRCPNPFECKCSEYDDMENMKCGPCSKCKKRATDMQSSLAATKISRVSRSSENRRKVNNYVEKTINLVKYIWFWILNVWYHFAESDLITRMTRTSDDDLISHTFAYDNRYQFPRPRFKHKVHGVLRSIYRLYRGSEKISYLGRSAIELRNLQLQDVDLGRILTWKESGPRPYGPDVCSSSPETRHYWNYWNSLEVIDGLLFKRFHPKEGIDSYLQFLVPKAMRSEILKQAHNSLLGGHLGTKKTIQKILQRFYWFELRIDVRNWIICCDLCGANKCPQKYPKAPLGDMRVGAPMDRLAVDILGPLPVTPRSNRFIMVVTDAFTKWVEAIPIPDQTAPTCASYLLNEVISRFGCPLNLHSDQGRNFESQIFTELCKLLEVRKTRTSPRNPRCNGQTERFNKTLVPMIRAFIKGEQKNWDLYLGCLTSAYRATENESTGFTPNFLMLGREVKLPMEVTVDRNSKSLVSYGDYVDGLRSRLQKAHEIAGKHLESTLDRQKCYYDAKCYLNLFNPGDMVWMLAESHKEGICHKLEMPYDGPL